MKALIVAAGQGLRLRPHTDAIPKPMLEVGGEPLIERSIHILNSHGIRDITVVVGYRQDRIRELLGDSVSYIVNEDYADTNNMASMYLGRQAAEGGSYLYLHSDLWYHPDIIGIALDHLGEISFLIEEKRCGEEEMKVRVEDGCLVEADKAIPPTEAAGEWLGIIRFEPAGASAYFRAQERALRESKTLYDCTVVRDMAVEGTAIRYATVGNLPWVEIDFAEDMEYARSLAKERSVTI